MKDYNEILKQIKNDLMEEDVISDNDIISLYDLCNVLNLKFEPLRSATNEKNLFKYNGLFNLNLVKKLFFYVNSKEISIHVKITKNEDNYFYINKKYNDDDFSITANSDISKKYIKNFTKRHYNEIINIFSVLENFSELLIHFNETIEVFQKTDYYCFCITNKYFGKIDIVPYLLNADYINYYGKEELLKILEESKFELAKKIKINVKDLDHIIQSIIQEYFVLDNKICKNIEKSKL